MARARHAGAGVRRSTAGAVTALLLFGAAGGLYLTTRDGGPEPSLAAPGTAPTSAPPSATPSSAGPSSAAPSSTPPSSTPPSSTPPSSPGPAASSRSSAPPEALLACGRAVRAAERAVEAGSRGSQNWGVHVQAYRDVVDGDISYPAADRRWTRTKEAGGSDVTRFDEALDAYQPAGDACRAVGQEAGETSAALAEACAERAEVADAAVQRVERIMQGWEDHLEQMAQRDGGRLGEAKAQRLFRGAVSRTPGEIEALRRSEDRLERAPECDVPA